MTADPAGPGGERRVGATRLTLVQGDITEQRVDAVVNAANSSLLGGGGVDGAIHRRGGPAILEACRALRAERLPEGLPTGDAVETPAGDLPADAVIHTVGPRWKGGRGGEAEKLASAYRRSLEVAEERGRRTVAFPSISTGVYGYPVTQAAEIALGAVVAALEARPGAFEEVRFVLFSEADLAIYREALEALG
ncbi:MAG: O-acetyl-ADP-ribose deacetylase [Gemmatimonadota bacterium]|jgi:O-acetyl-ADP-ribose deacetylase (regulator of RNase III)